MFLINGRNATSLSLHDRAIHYGDGVFETLAVQNGEILALSQHLQRLSLACQRLSLVCPEESLLIEESNYLCKEKDKGVLKWIVSRGEGGRGYQPPKPGNETRIMAIYDWPNHPKENAESGIDVHICQQRLGHQPMLAGLKHLNRLEQILLRQELAKLGGPEGVVLDLEGNVIEGTMSNIFLIKEKNLLTPDLSRCGVNGVIRELVLESAFEHGLTTSITQINPGELKSADEVFFCNSIIGIWPVRELEGHILKRGPYSHDIRQLLVKRNMLAA